MKVSKFLAVASLLVAGLPTLAMAQRGWREPVLVSAVVHGVEDARIAIEPDGAVTAVWVESFPIAFVVKASRMEAGGVWSPPVNLSNPQSDADPAVAADPTGGVLAVWTSDTGVFAARFSPASNTWSPAASIALRSSARAPDVAIDDAGNATVAWYIDDSDRVETIGYSATSGTWGAVADLGPGRDPRVDVDAAGDAIALWGDASVTPSLVRTARYSVATGLWSAPATLATSDRFVPVVDLAVRSQGDAMAVWTSLDSTLTWRIQVAAYSATAGTWSSPVTLWSDPYQLFLPQPRTAFAADDALVTWLTPDQGVLYSRYDLSTGAGWSAAAPVGQPGRAAAVDLAADGLGGAIVVWQMTDGTVYGGRYSRGPQPWTWRAPLAPAGVNSQSPRVTVDPTGTATVVWNASAGNVAAVLGITWDATLPAPSITGVTASAGMLSLDVVRTGEPLPDFEPRNYEYSIDGGATWVERVPASATSPLVIQGLTDLVPYAIRVRTVNVAGPGEASPAVTAIAGPGSDAPSGLIVARVVGSRVTFKWIPPAVGALPTSYVIEGGVAPGQTLASIPSDSPASTLTVELPTGVFYARVRAVALSRTSGPSNEVRLVVNVPEPPSAPVNLLGLVDGSAIALSWTNTFDGGAPTGVSLVVSGAVDALLPLGLAESFQLASVPPGTYTLQVVAVNGAGSSAPSNPVTLTFPAPCSGSPGMPTRMIGQRSGRTLVVTWEPPTGGGAVTHYWVSVSGSHVGAFPTTDRAMSGAVGPGTYSISVAAANACGLGPATIPTTVVVP